MKDTAIEWADNTINFYVGCTKVSEGCKNCYMFRLEERFGRDPKVIRKTNWKTIESNLKNWPPSRIFVNSMSDTFHESLSYEQICEMFHVMLKYPNHQYMILTKRSGRARIIFKEESLPNNFLLGVSVENNNHLGRIDDLLECDGVYNKFLSLEPLLGQVTPDRDLTPIKWVIVGGESDFSNPRLPKQEWIDEIKEWCDIFHIPFFFKQWGGKRKCECHKTWGCRVYKNQTWDELPKIEVVCK
jgi:protein gp37